MSLCNDCPNRSICQTLCPEAILYVNQDNVSLKKLLGAGRVYKKKLSDVDLMAVQEEENMIDAFFQLPRKKQVLTLLQRRMSRAEIAKVLGITRENVRDVVRRLKKDLTDNPLK